MTPLRDQAARDTAARDVTRNLVVTAGAGTGKTSLLVGRMLNLLLSGAASLDEIVALTFSKKAAAEMRERLAEAVNAIHDALAAGGELPETARPEAHASLAWLLGGGSPGETAAAAADGGSAPRDQTTAALHARARALLDDLDGAAIGTIHSFASDLLRRHPVEAGLAPDFQPDEGEGEALLRKELWPRFLRDELGADSPRRDAWTAALGEFPLDEIEDIASALLARPQAVEVLGDPDWREPAATDVLGDEPARLLRAVASVREEAKPGDLRGMLDLQAELLRLLVDGDFPAFARAAAAVPKKIWNRDEGYKAKKTVAADRKEAVEAIATEAHMFLKAYHRMEGRDLSGLLRLLRGFIALYHDEATRRGLVSMDELLLRARAMLRDNPSVRAVEARRARHLLVDEFQDTDPLQYEIVFYLVAAGDVAPGADPYALALEEGRLFIVGDPKQSIYRFRGADIAAYRRSVERIAPGRTLELTENFRSVPGVVEPVNHLFNKWMQADGDATAEIDYARIEAHRTAGKAAADGAPTPDPAGDETQKGSSAAPKLAGTATRLLSVHAKGRQGARAGREAEAEAIAGLIESLIPEPVRLRLRPPDPAKGEFGPRDIALLFRGLTDVPLYVRALRDRGLDVVVDGGKSFAERPEFTEALALLRCVANPGDPVAFLAVLRSTLGGVSDARLAAYARAGHAFTWRQDAEALEGPFPEIAACVYRLRALSEAHRELPLDRFIHALLVEGDYALLSAAYYDGAQRIANLRKLAGRAAELALGRGLTLEALTDTLEEEYAGAMGSRAEGESPLADESVDAVRILSVHKAKGLEFPVVFLPDLNRGSRNDRREVGVVVTGIGAARHLAVSTRMGDNLAMIRHRDEEKAHEEAEQKRLLYVAMTRAKEKLFLVQSGVERFSPWVKALQEHWGYAVDGKSPEPFAQAGPIADGLVEHEVVEVPGERRVPPPEKAPELVAEVRAFDALRESLPGAAVRRFRTPSSDHRATAVDDGQEEESTAPVVAAAREDEPVPHPADARVGGAADAPAAHAAGAGVPGVHAAARRALAMAVGSVVHRALERWDFRDPDESRRLVRRMAAVEAARHAPFAARIASAAGAAGAAGASGASAHAADAPEITPDTLAAEGLAAIEGLLASAIPARLAAADAVWREVPILFRDANDVVVHGFADLVYRAEGRVRVADWKTDVVTGPPEVAAARYASQLADYAECVRRAMNLSEPPVREVIFVRTGRCVEL